MVRRQILTVLLFAAVACRPGSPDAPQPASEAARKGTIVLVESTLQENGRVLQHEVVETGGLVRFRDEVDRWRLINLTQRTVTFVDEIAGTRREMTLAELRERKQQLAAGSVPDWYPPATFRKTGESREILGRMTDQYLVEAGGFTRELWVTREPVLGSDLMALHFGSDEPGGPNPAALARIHLQLMELQGYPLIDRISMPVGTGRWGVVRQVRSIQEGPVASSLFEIPAEFGGEGQAPELAAPSFPVPDTPR